jgi:hypothetical protein
MGTIYLANILHKSLIYSKYTLFNVTIISNLFILIIILEYTSNMVVDINSKYMFINLNTLNYIFYNSLNTPLYIHRVAIKLVTLTTNGT